MARYPHVALLIESARGYGRGLLHGVADFIRLHGPWSLYHERHQLYDSPPAWLKGWQGDGILARVENRRMAQAIRDCGVPAVDLRGRLADLDMPSLLTDDEAGVRMAVEHLLDRGFRQFAFCGFVGTRYSDERSRIFNRILSEAGFPCATYQPPARVLRHAEDREQEGLIYEADLAQWLAKLPRPVGIMACNDVRGQQVLNACRAAGIAVPDELAVVGVDNDDVVCDLSDPPLSSVEPNTRRIGYEAAALLEGLMAGKPAPRQPILIPPLGIVTRRSTDVLAVEDRDLRMALRFIREHACDGITVEDVLARVPVSSSTLERQFHKLLGRTPKAEIIRVQLGRVKQLLAETKLPLKEIAARAGFAHVEYLSVLFKSKTGQTPGQYRALAQGWKVPRPGQR